MIAACPDPSIAYLWEPFSLLHRPGICAASFPHWFPYVCRENAGPYVLPIGDMLAFRYRPGAELFAVRSLRDAVRLPRDWLRFTRYQRSNARPLLKDPIAVFSAEWLDDTFGMDVIVLIRHPAAFANSLIRRGWTHPFDHFLNQPLLMRDLLSGFEAQIREFAAHEQSPIDQAILLWTVIHHAILRYRDERPEWLFLRLEDIARDPEPTFQAVYDRLALPYSESVRRTILEHTDPSNPVEVTDLAAVKRNSKASVQAWKSRLAPKDVDRIRTGTEPIASAFYSDEDW